MGASKKRYKIFGRAWIVLWKQREVCFSLNLAQLHQMQPGMWFNSSVFAAMYEAERLLNEDLRKFYRDEEGPRELIIGSATSAGLKYVDTAKDETAKVLPLVRILAAITSLFFIP